MVLVMAVMIAFDYWIVIGNEHTDKRVLAWRITSPANETHVSKCRSHEDDTSRYTLFSHHLGRSLPNQNEQGSIITYFSF